MPCSFGGGGYSNIVVDNGGALKSKRSTDLDLLFLNIILANSRLMKGKRVSSFKLILCAVSCKFRCQQLKSLKMSNYSLKYYALYLMNQATAFEIIGDRCLWDLTCWAHRESRRGETLLLTNTVTVEVISPLGANAFMEATFIFKKSSIVAVSNLLLLMQKSYDNCVYI